MRQSKRMVLEPMRLGADCIDTTGLYEHSCMTQYEPYCMTGFGYEADRTGTHSDSRDKGPV